MFKKSRLHPLTLRCQTEQPMKKVLIFPSTVLESGAPQFQILQICTLQCLSKIQIYHQDIM